MAHARPSAAGGCTCSKKTPSPESGACKRSRAASFFSPQLFSAIGVAAAAVLLPVMHAWPGRAFFLDPLSGRCRFFYLALVRSPFAPSLLFWQAVMAQPSWITGRLSGESAGSRLLYNTILKRSSTYMTGVMVFATTVGAHHARAAAAWLLRLPLHLRFQKTPAASAGSRAP